MRTLSAQIGVLILGTQNFEWAAFYGLSVMIANIVGGISLAVSRAILPTASEEWVKGNKVKFRSVFNTAIRISLLLSGFAFMIFMIDPGYILTLLSEPYREASDALRILVVASIINAVGAIIISMLNAANRAHIVARIGLLSSGITIALTFLLAPAIELEGAAVAILVGSLATLIPSVTMLKIKEQVTISTNSAIKPIISISIGLLVGYSAYSLGVNVLLSLTFATISYVGFSLIYRVTTQTELKTLLNIVLRTKRSLDR
jgi:O-antigen/teichoic acid export membrane protein